MKYIYILLALFLLCVAGINFYDIVIENEDLFKKIGQIIAVIMTVFGSILCFAKAITYDDEK